MKTNVKDVAKKLGLTVDETLALASSKLTDGVTGKGKSTWFSPEAVDILSLAREAPMALADKLRGVVLGPCRNPTWVYAKIDNLEGKKLVHISRRHVGALIGKRIPIEAITDDKGTTYRHDLQRARPNA